MYELKFDIKSYFTLSTLIVYENVFTRYVKVSLSLTGGITSLFTLRYGLNYVDELPFLNTYLRISLNQPNYTIC